MGQGQSSCARFVLALLIGCAQPPEIGGQSAEVSQGFADQDRYEFVEGSGSDFRFSAIAAIRHVQTIQQGGYVLDHASCGATFLSPHLAVTASHCVENLVTSPYLVNPGEFFVEQVRTGSSSEPSARSAGAVTGSWPNWTSGNTFSPPSGYAVDRFACTVRCGRSATGASNCFSDSSRAGIDVALIDCPARPDDAWAVVSSTPETTDAEVDVRWYHEYVDLPTSGVPGDERYDRYQGFADLNGINGPLDDNYHYSQGTVILWPLLGDTDASGNQATVTSAGGVSFGTNLFGCHGTSGSGVFSNGTTQMYGPVSTGGFSGLCGEGISSISQVLTLAVEARSDVQNDRNGVYP